LTAAVPLTPISTLYSRLGNTFGWLCVILFLTCLTLGILFHIRKQKLTPRSR
jgi:apolipoprotein N-acyltransferase